MKHVFTLILFLLAVDATKAQVSDTLTHDGLARDYIVYTHAGYDGSTATPLVLNLHGRGSNAFQQMAYSTMNLTADDNNFIVAYPNSLAYAGQTQWNIFTGAEDLGTDDVGFLLNLIDTLVAEYNIDTNRIYICGMSMGGFMSYRMVCEQGEVFAAMASVTGLPLYTSLDSCVVNNPTVPIMQMHGTLDAVVPFNGIPGVAGFDSTLHFFRDLYACDATVEQSNSSCAESPGMSSELSVYNNCGSNGQQLEFYQINGGGHTWPGAVVSLGSPTYQCFDGSTVLWEFFNRFDKNGAREVGLRRNPLENLSIYPNPTSDILVLPSDVEIDQWSVYDVSGRLVERLSSRGSNTLYVGFLPSGWYTLTSTQYKASFWVR